MQKELVRTRILDWLFDAWWLDWTVVILATASAIIFIPTGGWADILHPLSATDRGYLYSDLLTVAALLAGFSSVAFTTYLGWQSKNIERLRKHANRKLTQAWVSVIAAPWLAVIVIWLVRVLDRGDPPTSDIRWIALGSLLLLIFNIARCLWVFLELLPTESGQGKPTQGVSSGSLKLRDQ